MSYSATTWTTGDIVTQTKANNWEAQYAAVFNATAKTFAGSAEVAIATGGTSTDGHSLVSTTPATVGAQKYSPRSRWKGFGWKTDATAGSQSVEFGVEVRPYQGAAAPFGYWVLSASVNGGAFADVLGISSSPGTPSSANFLRGDGTWQAISFASGAWTAPTLSGDWANLGSGFTIAGYRKLKDSDTVMIRGVVLSSGNRQGNSYPVFTLPAGYRPAYELIVSGNGYPCETAGTTVQIRISTSGNVYVQKADNTNYYISLDGITFSVS